MLLVFQQIQKNYFYWIHLNFEFGDDLKQQHVWMAKLSLPDKQLFSKFQQTFLFNVVWFKSSKWI